jgi:hypothetical protein
MVRDHIFDLELPHIISVKIVPLDENKRFETVKLNLDLSLIKNNIKLLKYYIKRNHEKRVYLKNAVNTSTLTTCILF